MGNNGLTDRKPCKAASAWHAASADQFNALLQCLLHTKFSITLAAV